MRPTGRLHIGHYFGALENWVRLQNARVASGEKEYECFYFIADWHALTSDYADTSAVAENSIEIAIDFLASGIEPKNIFLQSWVPEHAELHLLLSMVTPLGWLERVPTYKEALENVTNRDLHTYGFLGYPVLQTADIVIYSEEGVPLFVPVGEDQVSHVELSREIVRKFNFHFSDMNLDRSIVDEQNANVVADLWSLFQREIQGFPAMLGLSGISYAPIFAALELGSTLLAKQIGYDNFLDAVGDNRSFFLPKISILQEPQHMLTKTPRIPGLDGRKMSKSYGNAITLSETDEEIRKKTKVMVTDPARKRRTDAGNPDICPVYDWHKLFSAGEPGRLEWVRTGCTTAGIGCIECKSAMADNLIKWIEPVRERRVKWENDRKGAREIIEAGSKRARAEAQKTMARVREAVFGWEKAK
jgi:tryptophanyl-tRNA synthetase